MLVICGLFTEIAAFSALSIWMAYSLWRSSRGDRRVGDTARLVVLSFSLLLIYRDWRIIYVDDSVEAKAIMVILGLSLCAFTAFTAKAYGRGARIP